MMSSPDSAKINSENSHYRYYITCTFSSRRHCCITAKEIQEFLIATVALVIAADAAADIIALGLTMSMILSNIVTFVFPAALLVALKAIWTLASE